MKGLVVGFSGRIATGKSTVAELVAQSTNCPLVSFGDCVRKVVAERGLEPSRENLQAVGAELVSRDAHAFCQLVVGQARFVPGGSLIVDGVRHVEVLDILKQICAPSKVYLVSIEVAPTLRYQRLVERGVTTGAIEAADSHSTESQATGALREAADLVLDGSRSPEELASVVVERMKLQWQPA